MRGIQHMRTTTSTNATGHFTRPLAGRTAPARMILPGGTLAPILMAVAAFAFALTAVATLPSPASAQSAADLMRGAMDAQAARLAGVDDVTLTQDIMGMSVGVYMEKRTVGGTPVLVPVSTIMAGQVRPIPQDDMAADWANPFQQAWVERVRLEGADQVDGRPVRVLVMDDFTGLELPRMPGQTGRDADFRPKSMRFSLDDDYLIRKVEMDAEAVQDDGTTAPLHLIVYLEDYRDVDGYVHPFRTRTITEGMLGAANVDQEELRAQLEAMRRQIASTPEAQRGMMERMMGPQLERLQAMLSSEEGEMEMTMTVTDLKVNAGPPRG